MIWLRSWVAFGASTAAHSTPRPEIADFVLAKHDTRGTRRSYFGMGNQLALLRKRAIVLVARRVSALGYGLKSYDPPANQE